MTNKQTTMTMTTPGRSEPLTLASFKKEHIGRGVTLAHPGHVCSRFDKAILVAIGVGPGNAMLSLRFQNGLLTYCQPERIASID